MDVTPLIPKGSNYITSYTGSGFRINAQWIEGSIILGPNLLQKWDLNTIEDLTCASFGFIDRKAPPEIILFGCGASFMPLSQKIKRHCLKEKFSVEEMDTPAACRTYNVLLSEGRDVLAMLLQAN